MGKVKNQHYVPRFYLEYFTNQQGKIGAFDLTTRKSFVTTIEKVAHKKYFYDHEYLDGKIGEQAAEKALSIRENEASKVYKRTIENLEKGITGKLTFEDRIILAEHITMQMFRTPEYRTTSEEVLKEMNRQLQEKGGDEEFINYNQKFSSKDQQLRSLFSSDFKDRVWTFYDRYWVFWKNDTKFNFYTSDHPVVGHIHNEIGLNAYEIYFPLTPRFAVSILIKNEFPEYEKWDNSIISLNNSENIKFYNSLIIGKCNRQIYCSDNNFKLVEKILKLNPEISNPDKPRLNQT